MFDLKGKAKWDMWNSKKGMSQDAAKEAYIKYVDELLEKYKEEEWWERIFWLLHEFLFVYHTIESAVIVVLFIYIDRSR